MSSVRISNDESRKNVKEKRACPNAARALAHAHASRATHRAAALSAARCLLHLAVLSGFCRGPRPPMTSARLRHCVQTPQFRVRAHTPAQQASTSAAGSKDDPGRQKPADLTPELLRADWPGKSREKSRDTGMVSASAPQFECLNLNKFRWPMPTPRSVGLASGHRTSTSGGEFSHKLARSRLFFFTVFKPAARSLETVIIRNNVSFILPSWLQIKDSICSVYIYMQFTCI